MEKEKLMVKESTEQEEGLYSIPVDASWTWEDGEIDVETFTVSGKTADEARDKLLQEIHDGEHVEVLKGRETYVWSIDETDRVAKD